MNAIAIITVVAIVTFVVMFIRLEEGRTLSSQARGIVTYLVLAMAYVLIAPYVLFGLICQYGTTIK